jgi:hypothetical protein
LWCYSSDRAGNVPSKAMQSPCFLLCGHADGEPNMPFFLHWANEPWTRRWDGVATQEKGQVLLPMTYDAGEDDWRCVCLCVGVCRLPSGLTQEVIRADVRACAII